MRFIILSWAFWLITAGISLAQQTIDVTFRYYAGSNVERAFVPGEFNEWGHNNSGRIAVDDESLMQYDSDNGFWYKTITLKEDGSTGGGDQTEPYEYKFHEQYNASGSDWQWFTDPINPETNESDNNNSIVDVRHPMIFQLQPATGSVIKDPSPEIWATVAARSTDSIDVAASTIMLNGKKLDTFEGHYLDSRQLLHVSSLAGIGGQLKSGENTIKVNAVTRSGAARVDSTVFTYFLEPTVTDQPRPEGIEDGINYGPEGTSVTLLLFAPHKNFVHVIGDFNNWKINSDYLMKRDSVSADSVWYWLKIDGLQAGKEYGFQYLVDGELRVADPYAEKVLQPDDQYISDETYPNLKPYPGDQTDFAVSVLQPGKTKYDWKTKDFERPDPEDLVVYELLVRDFVEKHDFATLTDTLDYLDRLGVNAIELMPVMEFEGNISWGYNSAFHFAVDKYYGPARDLKRFIDAAHQKGIAVILDMVLNHVYGQSPLVRLWNEGDYGKPTTQNPYLNVSSPNQTFSFGYDFNHESKATQYYVDRVTRYWLDEFNVDGYRFDFTKGFTQKSGDGWSYDASRIDILERMADQQWSVDSTSYVILEHFAENSEEKELSNYGMMLWGNLNSAYNEATMGYHDNGKSNFSGVYYGDRGWSDPHLVGYMESHDEQRLMYKNLTYGNCTNLVDSYQDCRENPGPYNVQDLKIALRRMKTAGAFFFTIPGPKMIWQFGELGYDISIDKNGRTGPKPVKWSYYDQLRRRNLYKTWKAMLRLRHSDPVFSDGTTDVSYSLGNAVKRMELSNGQSGTEAVILGNFGVDTTSASPRFTQTGKWYDFFSGDSMQVSDPQATVALGPGEFHIWTTRRFKPPEQNILVNIDNERKTDIPDRFRLHQNYPNPFNPTTTIRYELPEAATVRLDVYSILGRKVATLVDGRHQQAGSYTAEFDATGLSSGIYFARMQVGSRVMTKKMLLLK